MKTFFSILLILLLSACQSSVESYDKIGKIFQKDKATFEAVADYLQEQGDDGYDYVSFVYLDDGSTYLTLSQAGVQKREEITGGAVQKELDAFLGERKYYIHKKDGLIYFLISGTKEHGVESGSGLVKQLGEGRPNPVAPPWVGDGGYDIRDLEGDWYYYGY